MQEVASSIDRYQVVRRIGAGGMGVVYEADDVERGQKVALKTISNPDVEKIYQLKREFRALADLSHPNLVALYDLVVAADSCFFTMELLDGVDLLTYLWGRKVEDPAEMMPTTLTPIPPGFVGADEAGRHRGQRGRHHLRRVVDLAAPHVGQEVDPVEQLHREET